MDPNNPTSKFVNAFYGGFHRAAWGIALGWLIFACCKGYGGDVYYNFKDLLEDRAEHFIYSSDYRYCLIHAAIYEMLHLFKTHVCFL